MNSLNSMALGCLISGLVFTGCTTSRDHGTANGQRQVLEVRWQRLVDEKGETCARCGSTEKAVAQAVKQLRRSLKPIDVEVVLQKTSISLAEFTKDPLSSNEIVVGDKPLEQWLQAEVGQSQCSGPCGDSVCRTLTVEGKVYETIPAELIVRAGLLAGAQLSQSQSENPWNPMGEWSKDSSCCPPAAGPKK